MTDTGLTQDEIAAAEEFAQCQARSAASTTAMIRDGIRLEQLVQGTLRWVDGHEAATLADARERDRQHDERERVTIGDLRSQLRAEVTDRTTALPVAACASGHEGIPGSASHDTGGNCDCRQVSDVPGMRIGILSGPAVQGLPALLPHPLNHNLTVYAGEQARGDLRTVLEALLTRSLLEQPVGGLHIHTFDPRGNGTTLNRFAANPRTGGVFTAVAVSVAAMADRVTQLAERIAHVTQDILRGTHPTLAAYNAREPAHAQPHHILIALDTDQYPPQLAAAVSTLARTGPDCGVTVLAHRGDGQQPGPGGGVELRHTEGRFRLDVVAGGLGNPVELDPPVDTDFLQRTVKAAEARAGLPAVVALAQLLADIPRWSMRPGDDISAPIGYAGRNPYAFRLAVRGEQTPVHALLGGMTGMGKSAALHTLICALTHCYSPRDLRLYLVDGKDGVELKRYAADPRNPATHLPHAAVVAVQSDVEMFLSVLAELEEERQRRSALLRTHGVPNVVELAETGVAVPRIVAIFDEFQVLLADPVYGGTAAGMFEGLARKGRNVGIHLVLATQTLDGLGAQHENRALFGQFGLRIALRTRDIRASEALLGDGNSAAAKLAKAGQAIANSGTGPADNEPIQIAYLPTDLVSRHVDGLIADRPAGIEPPFVFAGGEAAELAHAEPLVAALGGEPTGESAGDVRLWLGGPVRVSSTVCAVLGTHRGGNLAVLGRGDAARAGADVAGVLIAAATSAVAQLPDARFVLIAPLPSHGQYAAVTAFAGWLSERVTGRGTVELVATRDAAARLAELAAEVTASPRGELLPRRTFVVAFDADRIGDDLAFAGVVDRGPEAGLHVLGAWPSRAAAARAVVSAGLAPTAKALVGFGVRVIAQLTADEQGAVGLHRRISPAADRMALWQSSDPNDVTPMIPIVAPGADDWAALDAVVDRRSARTDQP